MDKIIASLQLLLGAQVPIETVNDLWRALWMAQAHWLHQPKKTFMSQFLSDFVVDFKMLFKCEFGRYPLRF